MIIFQYRFRISGHTLFVNNGDCLIKTGLVKITDTDPVSGL